MLRRHLGRGQCEGDGDQRNTTRQERAAEGGPHSAGGVGVNHGAIGWARF
jgi:hypothetical protein